MENKKNIILTGGNFSNKGAEAMTLYVANLIKQNYPQYNIILFTANKKDINKKSDLLKPVYFDPHPLRALKWLFNSKYIKNSQAIISIHGFLLSEDFGINSCWYGSIHFIIQETLAKLNKTPFLIFPQSIGPINKFRNKPFIKLALNLASEIVVRGQMSADWVKKLAPRKKYQITNDMAFSLADKHVQSSEEKIITIVPNRNIKFKLNKQGVDYEKIIAQVIDYYSNKDFQVILMPFEITQDSNENDLTICQKIYSLSNKQENIRFIQKDVDAQKLNSILALSTVNFVGRFHSAVASLKAGVPCLVNSWSFKYKELLNWFDLTELALEYQNLDSQKIITKIDNILENHEQYKTKITSTVKQFNSEEVLLNILKKYYEYR